MASYPLSGVDFDRILREVDDPPTEESGASLLFDPFPDPFRDRHGELDPDTEPDVRSDQASDNGSNSTPWSTDRSRRRGSHNALGLASYNSSDSGADTREDWDDHKFIDAMLLLLGYPFESDHDLNTIIGDAVESFNSLEDNASKDQSYELVLLILTHM
ncbi:hypothetical protein BKA67DRAFT_540516 [Truncatella angustata]|uniref:Uncharacterized protein n=1 Tax=Truncatella angustata TaxID=152316 RepID=A0A9P8RN61_9PEZI|nr:uncharacterized protein BKA67DRAFT_540516 [Truncatella angustata]KAH6647056.1 hypothetical protein BKA67DRAFT_540516 [Truncatella angustata]